MQTYTIEAAKAELAVLVDLAAKGEEFVLTKNNKPMAKLVPADRAELYRQRVRALRGSAPGIDTTVVRDHDRV